MVVELLAAVAGVAARVVDSAAPRRSVEPALAGHVGLEPDDGVDALLAARLVEVDGAVHVAVVGHADRRLPVGHRGAHHVGDPRRAIEHRVLGVQMQVGERRAHESLRLVHRLLWTKYTRVITSCDRSAIRAMLRG